LKNFSIGYNELSGELPSQLASLNKLESVSIRNNVDLTGRALDMLLPSLSNLKHLIIDGTRLSGTIPQNISRFASNLRTFTIESTPIGGTIPYMEFNKLTNMQRLVIADNNNMEGTIPDLGVLSNLGKFD
jgi:hypothetical protein